MLYGKGGGHQIQPAAGRASGASPAGVGAKAPSTAPSTNTCGKKAPVKKAPAKEGAIVGETMQRNTSDVDVRLSDARRRQTVSASRCSSGGRCRTTRSRWAAPCPAHRAVRAKWSAGGTQTSSIPNRREPRGATQRVGRSREPVAAGFGRAHQGARTDDRARVAGAPAAPEGPSSSSASRRDAGRNVCRRGETALGALSERKAGSAPSNGSTESLTQLSQDVQAAISMPVRRSRSGRPSPATWRPSRSTA
jgi:hypothetical protein